MHNKFSNNNLNFPLDSFDAKFDILKIAYILIQAEGLNITIQSFVT
jgi:hypothetical protein